MKRLKMFVEMVMKYETYKKGKWEEKVTLHMKWSEQLQ